jgi:myosin protein heavy chain
LSWKNHNTFADELLYNLLFHQVRYNVNGWLEKNKDPINDTAVSVLKNSTQNKLLKEIWDDFQTQQEAVDAHAKSKLA